MIGLFSLICCLVAMISRCPHRRFPSLFGSQDIEISTSDSNSYFCLGLVEVFDLQFSIKKKSNIQLMPFLSIYFYNQMEFCTHGCSRAEMHHSSKQFLKLVYILNNPLPLELTIKDKFQTRT